MSDQPVVKKERSVSLGLSNVYVSDWEPKHAFRELYQNCHQNEVRITIRWAPSHNGSDTDTELLGYIRFDKTKGVLEMTNVNAKLERKHLGIGESTKRQNSSQNSSFAGCHGEGFKLAALVMLRNNYAFKFETDSKHWHFSMGAAEEPVTLRSHCKHLGGYNDFGWQGEERQLCPNSSPNFESWLSFVFELNPPAPDGRIRTRKGDLLLDEGFAGRVYLRSPRISDIGPDGGPDGEPYKYGYNLHEGAIRRERERLKDSYHQMKMVLQIWQAAIEAEAEADVEAVDIIDRDIDLFLMEKAYSDIANAAESVTLESRVAVLKVWKRLQDKFPDVYFYREKTYFQPVEADLNSGREEDIIVNDLGRRPVKLPKKLWKFINRFSLAKTPVEARNKIFNNSDTAEPSNTSYHIHILRALKAFSALGEELAELKGLEGLKAMKSLLFRFVTGGTATIDVLYSSHENEVRIHKKWLDYGAMHQNTTCEYFALTKGDSGANDSFFYDHIVEGLLEALLNELRRLLKLDQRKAFIFRHKAIECFRQVPREIKMFTLAAGGSIEVNWTDNPSRSLANKFGDTIRFHVTLHKTSSCGIEREKVLNADETELRNAVGGGPDETAESGVQIVSCRFPSRIVSQADSKVIFDDLDYTESYFAMVSRARSLSFFGMPPTALAPLVSSSSASVAGLQSSTATAVRQPTQRETRSLVDEQNSPYKKTRGAFSRLIPARREHGQNVTEVQAPRYDPDLDYTFEPLQFVQVQLSEALTEQVIFIHGIFQHKQQSQVYYLRATIYSPVSSSFPFDSLSGPGSAESGNELVLHFGDFHKMGTPQDAELILLADVSEPRLIGCGRTTVQHVFQHTPANHNDFFCRFGIRGTVSKDVASFTPLASHLLEGNEERWKNTVFHNPAMPLAFELSPDVLGVSEGFSDAGFSIQAAFDLDETQPSTWKDRHNSAQQFDGNVLDTLGDLDAGRILPVQLPDPVPPRVVIYSSGQLNFRLNNRNEQMSTLDQFLYGLHVIDRAAAGAVRNFVVMFMPPALLHDAAVSRLSETILRLLQMRFSVHLRLVQVKDFGLPQERNILAIIASRLCTQLPWKSDRYPIQDLGDLIADLTFKKSRMGNKSCTGFVCSPPQDDGESEGTPTLSHVYNHYTGIVVEEGPERVHVNQRSVLNLANGSKMWMHWHPDRQDRLTIRELARVQGMPDDFKFWGGVDAQYEEVCMAIPPIIAKMVAETVRQAIQDTLPVTINTPRRTTKRARVENAEDND